MYEYMMKSYFSNSFCDYPPNPLSSRIQINKYSNYRQLLTARDMVIKCDIISRTTFCNMLWCSMGNALFSDVVQLLNSTVLLLVMNSNASSTTELLNSESLVVIHGTSRRCTTDQERWLVVSPQVTVKHDRRAGFGHAKIAQVFFKSTL